MGDGAKKLGGSAATVVSLAAAVFMQIHPLWVSAHPNWVRSLYVLAAALCILTLLQFRWMQRILGIHQPPTEGATGNYAGDNSSGDQINAGGNLHKGDVYNLGSGGTEARLPDPEAQFVRFDGWRWRLGGPGAVPGAIFWIHNKPAEKGGHVANAYGVSVSLTIKSGHKPPAHVSRSCWIDHMENAANIENGDRRSVLIATFYGLALKVYENKTELDTSIRIARRSIRDHVFRPVVRTEDVAFGSASLIEIEAVILSEGETLAERKFTCIKSANNELTIV